MKGPRYCPFVRWPVDSRTKGQQCENASIWWCRNCAAISREIFHYGDVIMATIASQITSLTIVYSTIYSDADQRKHQSFVSLVFVREIHRGPVNSLHKWPVTRKMFPFDDVITSLVKFNDMAWSVTTALEIPNKKKTLIKIYLTSIY